MLHIPTFLNMNTLFPAEQSIFQKGKNPILSFLDYLNYGTIPSLLTFEKHVCPWLGERTDGLFHHPFPSPRTLTPSIASLIAFSAFAMGVRTFLPRGEKKTQIESQIQSSFCTALKTNLQPKLASLTRSGDSE